MENKEPSNLFLKYLNILERLFLVLLIVGLILDFFDLGIFQLTSVSLIALAAVFFLSAYRPSTIPKPEEGTLYGFQELISYIIIPKVLWISTAVLTVGILFFTMNQGNNGYLTMIMVGGTSIVISSIVLLTSMAMGTKYLNHVTPVLLRSTPTLLIGIYLYIQSNA